MKLRYLKTLLLLKKLIYVLAHNFNSELYELITAKISIKNTFVGARTFILPGIIIGEDSIIGACSVITKDIGDNKIVKGNPAKVKDR